MVMLKEGASAVDGVEMAIKVLEDRVITNAGFGSNLSIDGTVECDATLVDHCGRSGAVGAVSQIRNPISLARLVLQNSLHEMSLRRIPPNLLVGEGAVDFAEEHGIPILPHDFLISDGARERYIKWKVELDKAEAGEDELNDSSLSLELNTGFDLQYEEFARQRSRAEHIQSMQNAVLRRKHTRSFRGRKILAKQEVGSHNPPPRKSSFDPDSPESWSTNAQSMERLPVSEILLRSDKHGLQDSIHFDGRQNPGGPLTLPQVKTGTQDPEDVNMTKIREADTREPELTAFVQQDGQPNSDSLSSSDLSLQLPSLSPSPPLVNNSRVSPSAELSDHEETVPTAPSSPRSTESGFQENRSDVITDTVGVIAVDSHGRIAAGSSSGGIGMKHRGRVGPAALVGIGSAVRPIDPDDKERTSVATVTSGTGEHIATTMAASLCADRLYNNLTKSRRGRLETASENIVMDNFIKNDFMDHPSVKYSTSSGAIGVLAVKKTKDGIYTYFAHNTDSFALASMHSDEHVPVCTMSRNLADGSIAQGARAMKYKRKSQHSSTGMGSG
ncbi:MAG: hypothetical protein M1837_005130 [Sclerophora amabilis]|nr:MAG: hypothetical protein M1837_005130 [Sclerophora amabilis]